VRARFWATVVVAAAVAVLAVGAGCGSDSDSSAVDECESDDTVVTVRDNTFEPQELEVEAGTTVCWANEGRAEHDVFPDEGDLFGLDSLNPGEAYRYTFEESGEYPYYCSIHGAPGSGQWGSVTVAS